MSPRDSERSAANWPRKPESRKLSPAVSECSLAEAPVALDVPPPGSGEKVVGWPVTVPW